jgi:peptide/nickel transport system permease protein
MRRKKMNTESKRALIAAVRKVVFAGLILLAVWLILFALRSAIPANIIDLINQRLQVPVSHDSAAWDWSRSLLKDGSVSSIIGERIGNTLAFIALCGIMSLIIAGILLFIGTLISRITQSPGWLAKLRGILRSILISGGASIPLFVISTILMVSFINRWNWGVQGDSIWVLLWAAFICSMLPAWLLVQTGHGIMAKRNGNIAGFKLAKEIGVRLLIRLLKLVGFIIVVSILSEQDIATPGLGRLLLSAVSSMDFPLIFGITWVVIIIVLAVKLVADLLEIAYNYSNKTASPIEQNLKESSLRFAVPKGWLIFALALCAFIALLAVMAPLLAPYGGNAIHLKDSLSPPSAKYILGTDQLGRDIFSRLLYGMRIDVLIGLVCAAVVSIVAFGWAILAAYCRKMNNWLGDTLEDLVMLPREIACAFPWLVLLLLIMSFRVDMSIVFVAFISGLVILPRAAGMIQAAYHSSPDGKSWLRGLLWSIPTVFLFTTAGVIIYTTTISYLGFGVPPGVPELGSILSGEGRAYTQTAPWIVIWPGLSLTFIILVFVMTGDALLEWLGFRSKAVWSKTME